MHEATCSCISSLPDFFFLHSYLIHSYLLPCLSLASGTCLVWSSPGLGTEPCAGMDFRSGLAWLCAHFRVCFSSKRDTCYYYPLIPYQSSPDCLISHFEIPPNLNKVCFLWFCVARLSVSIVVQIVVILTLQKT